MIIRYGFFILFSLLVSAGCQTQSPLLEGGDRGEPETISSHSAAESGINRAEEVDVVATPFGLVQVKKKDKSGSPSFQTSAEPEARRVPRDPPADFEPERTSKQGEEGGREEQRFPRQTASFIVQKPLAEEMSIPDVTSEDITLNFDNVELKEVIRALAEILQITCIVDPSVRGNATIYTAGKLRTTDLFDVFIQILEANGFTAVKSGNVYNIIPFKDASTMPIISRFGREGPESLRPEERIVMQIIPLNYMSATAMSKVLEPFVSSEGTIVTDDRSNILIIVDKGVNILKALRLVDTFDIDLFKDYTHQWFSIQNMDAEEMVKTLKDVLKAYGRDQEDFQMIAIKRLNRIVAISADKTFLSELEGLIKEFDQPDEGTDPRIYVYFMKNGQAEDFADILMSIFSTDAGAGKRSGADGKTKEPADSQTINPFDTQARTQAQAAVSAARGGGVAQGSGILRGTLKITPDAIRNALIIEAIPSDYQIVEGILNRLDVLPRQVLIEVVIAEISFDAKDELGVDWKYQDSDDGISLNLQTGSAGSEGLQFTLGQTVPLSASLSALASNNKANILSAPLVHASDNKEAKIDISDQLPVASASLSTTGDNPITQTTIQYRDTGIILMVTPHINDRGLVSMDISQEVSEEGAGKSVGGVEYPSFRQRRVNTSLTVGDGQTIVMGGLMREKEEKGRSGVPFFSSIPVLGFLFGKDTTERVKVDLMIFITPRVIVNLSDVDAITQEFQQKVNKIIFPKKKDENL
jgi:general secretion pathway protein D